MNTLSRILVAVDLSAPGRAAFDRALALARANGATLMAVHAVPAKRPFSWRALDRLALTASLRQAADAAAVRLVFTEQHGDPAGIILLHASSRRPDLIVLGSHQRTGFARWQRPSISEHVVQRASAPVLVVPVSARVAPSDGFANVVAASDLTPLAARVAESAIAMADRDGGRVTVVHALDGRSSAAGWSKEVPGGPRAEDATRQLQAMLLPHATIPDRVRTRVVIGDAPTAVERVARDIDADLIVVGVPARGAVARRVLGATAARLIRRAERPILTVPARRERAEHSSASANRRAA